jgi:hypothetical protein
MNDLRRLKNQELTYFVLFLGLLLGIYIWVYVVTPLPGTGNKLLVNLIYIVFSVYPAIILWKILRFYDKTEAPRRIWVRFFIGFALFFLGDVSWSVWNVLFGEVPTPSVAEIFYIPAYIFLAAGLFCQHGLIFPANKIKQMISSHVIFWIVGISGAAVIVFLRSGGLSLGDFIEYLYPVLDLLLAVVAISLIRAFGHGSLARPFLGFLVLFAADLTYAILMETGSYSFVIRDVHVGSLIVDVLYALAYIVFALGFWGHYAALRYDAQAGKDVRPD